MDASYNPDSNSRFQKLDKLALLARCPLFSSLSQWEIKSISQLMRLVEFKRDEIVYKEGQDADSFYVVVSGRFEAYVPVANKKKTLAYLKHGDHFGEMSLLTREPHSATIKAISDSLVLALKKEDFERTIEHNATLSLELSRRLSQRLKGNNAHAKPLFKSDVISVLSAQPKAERLTFAVNLAASLQHETHQKTILLELTSQDSERFPGDFFDKRVPLSALQAVESVTLENLIQHRFDHEAGFDVLSISLDARDSDSVGVLVNILNHLASEYRFIVADLPCGGVDELIFKVLSHSDTIFFFTDSHLVSINETHEILEDTLKTLPSPEVKIAVVIQEVFFGIRTTSIVRNEMFGKRKCFSLPATSIFSDGRGFMAVRNNPEDDYSRMVRHIARYSSNNLVGLVLGSGAAHGLAHIGVLKVLERENIPIDIIAGSSIGALIGSVYAVTQSAAELEEAALKINIRLLATKLIDFSLYPVRGLLNGREVMKHFAKQLGGKTFDNCKIALRVTGSNLSTRQVVIFDSGLIADAVRTSIAIPAIFKPVFIGGDVIVDGGILDPLPIRALQEAGANKIIAVNVFPSSKDVLEKRIMHEEASEKIAAAVRRKNIFARLTYWLQKQIVRCFFPNIFDILMNTIQFMESEIADIEGESADILIQPVVPSANWVEFYKPEQFIRKGEEEMEKALPKIKALIAQQISS